MWYVQIFQISIWRQQSTETKQRAVVRGEGSRDFCGGEEHVLVPHSCFCRLPAWSPQGGKGSFPASLQTEAPELRGPESPLEAPPHHWLHQQNSIVMPANCDPFLGTRDQTELEGALSILSFIGRKKNWNKSKIKFYFVVLDVGGRGPGVGFSSDNSTCLWAKTCLLTFISLSVKWE